MNFSKVIFENFLLMMRWSSKVNKDFETRLDFVRIPICKIIFSQRSQTIGMYYKRSQTLTKNIKRQQTLLSGMFYFSFQRTPAPDSRVPMNSMPADSKVFLMASRVLTWVPGTPSNTSKRIRVEKPIPDFSAKSFPLHLSMARAARIWSLVIK